MITNNTFLFTSLTVLLFVLYAHVSNHVDKYAESGNLTSRTIVLVAGLFFGAFGALLFLRNVADPGHAFGLGFFLGPLFAIGACIYVIVALFFPLEQVRGLLRYSFRHKLSDKLNP